MEESIRLRDRVVGSNVLLMVVDGTVAQTGKKYGNVWDNIDVSIREMGKIE